MKFVIAGKEFEVGKDARLGTVRVSSYFIAHPKARVSLAGFGMYISESGETPQEAADAASRSYRRVARNVTRRHVACPAKRRKERDRVVAEWNRSIISAEKAAALAPAKLAKALAAFGGKR